MIFHGYEAIKLGATVHTRYYLITSMYLASFVFSKLAERFFWWGKQMCQICVHFYFGWPHVGLSAKVLSF